jgi:hypothetical protein
MEAEKSPKRTKLIIGFAIFLVIGGILGYIAWDRGFREHPQPAWVTQDDATRFMYGSIGAEHDVGIPYWIFYVLPRMFPEKFPGNGGYASLGIPWEEGQELPIGFTKKTIGFPRVANNCAACHTAKYRTAVDAKPVFVPLGPGHTNNVQGFMRLIIDCAKDPRFNGKNILFYISLHTKLDWIDTLLYRFIIIPQTKKVLLARERQFQWIYNKAYPDWGRGRDDAMNLTKYFMIAIDPPDDGTFGPTDFPSIWNLKKYDSKEGDKKPQRLNLGGDTWDAYSVIMDSALGLLGAAPHDKEEFIGHVKWITDYAKRTPPPKFPFPIDENNAKVGKAVFDQHCASCHAEESDKVGRPLPLAEVGTNKDRLDTWGKKYAIESNKVVRNFGIERRGLIEEDSPGYNVPHLDGIWLRAPYLHNGSVPSLRDLLNPPAERPRLFYRGYDLYDPQNVGFVTQGDEAKKVGTPHDVSRKGNGNEGHLFGTNLPSKDKETLLEYMKTL